MAQIPIWYATGIIVTMIIPLYYGVTIIPIPMYDFDVFDKIISKYKPNYMVTPPTLLQYLKKKHPIYEPLKYLVDLVIGGEYITSNAEIEMNQWLEDSGTSIKLYKGYGTSECGGTVTASNENQNTIGSVGIPLYDMVVIAYDVKSDKELKYNERGEIRVQTPGRMLGYYNNVDATDKYFSKDKEGNIWLCTGDVGYVDENGCVFVDGRMKDSYIDYTGERIWLFDIERTVAMSKYVKQCKAVAVEIDGVLTHVINVVFNKTELESKTFFADILKICKEKLPLNHQPQYAKIYDEELPIGESGKLDLKRMREEAVDLIKLK